MRLTGSALILALSMACASAPSAPPPDPATVLSLVQDGLNADCAFGSGAVAAAICTYGNKAVAVASDVLKAQQTTDPAALRAAIRQSLIDSKDALPPSIAATAAAYFNFAITLLS